MSTRDDEHYSYRLQQLFNVVTFDELCLLPQLIDKEIDRRIEQLRCDTIRAEVTLESERAKHAKALERREFERAERVRKLQEPKS